MIPLEHLSVWRPRTRPLVLVSDGSGHPGPSGVHDLADGEVAWIHYRVPATRTLALEFEFNLPAVLNADQIQLSVLAVAERTGQEWPGTFNGIAFERLAPKADSDPLVNGWAASIVSIYVAEPYLFTFEQPATWISIGAGERWIEAIRHSRHPFEVDGLNGIIDEVAELWRSDRGRTAADLALAVLCELAYSLRALPTELNEELDRLQTVAAPCIERLGSAAAAADDLEGLGEMPQRFLDLSGAGRRIERLLQPMVRTVEHDDRLFGTNGDHPLRLRLARRQREALSDVEAARVELRTAADTFASSVAAQQLAMSYRAAQAAAAERQREARFARDATLIASLVLMPTLVASIFGANVALPFGGGARTTLTMLAAMIVLAATTLFTLQKRNRQ